MSPVVRPDLLQRGEVIHACDWASAPPVRPRRTRRTFGRDDCARRRAGRELPVAAHSPRPAVHAGRRHRRHRPQARARHACAPRAAGRHREQARRQCPHRRELRRQGRARRLHDPADHRRRLRDRAVHRRQAAVRFAQGFRARHPGGADRRSRRRRAEVSGVLDRRSDRARQARARQDQLCVDRRRRTAASRRRAAQAGGGLRHADDSLRRHRRRQRRAAARRRRYRGRCHFRHDADAPAKGREGAGGDERPALGRAAECARDRRNRARLRALGLVRDRGSRRHAASDRREDQGGGVRAR